MNKTAEPGIPNHRSISAASSTPYVFVFIAVLLWSTGGVFIKATGIDAFSVNLGRSLFAAVVVGTYLYFRKALKFDVFSVLSGLFYAATLSCFVYANKNTTAANAIFLQYTAPIYILVFAPLLLKERFRGLDLITVVACLIGMSLFFLDARNEGSGPNNTAGIISGLISGLCLGMYFVMLRHPKALEHNPALSVLTGNVIIVVVMIPFVATAPPSPVLIDYLSIGYLGIIQIALAYILFTHGVAKGVRSLDASIIGFTEPILNPIWVFLFIGEKPSIWTIGGGMLIISSVIIHTVLIGYQRRRRNQTELL